MRRRFQPSIISTHWNLIVFVGVLIMGRTKVVVMIWWWVRLNSFRPGIPWIIDWLLVICELLLWAVTQVWFTLRICEADALWVLGACDRWGGRDGAVGGRWESDKQITLSRLFPTMLVHSILFIFTHVKVWGDPTRPNPNLCRAHLGLLLGTPYYCPCWERKKDKWKIKGKKSLTDFC